MESIIALRSPAVAFDMAVKIGSTLTGLNYSPSHLELAQVLGEFRRMEARGLVHLGPGLGSVVTVSAGPEPIVWHAERSPDVLRTLAVQRLGSELHGRMVHMTEQDALSDVAEEELERLSKYPDDALTVITLTSHDTPSYTRNYASWDQTYLLYMIARMLGPIHEGVFLGPDASEWMSLKKMYLMKNHITRSNAAVRKNFNDAEARMKKWMEGLA